MNNDIINLYVKLIVQFALVTYNYTKVHLRYASKFNCYKKIKNFQHTYVHKTIKNQHVIYNKE